MIVDLAYAVMNLQQSDRLACRLRLIVASTSDPFVKLPANLAERLRSVCSIYKLDLPDRFAIHVPWSDQNESGTSGISSEAQRTDKALDYLLERNGQFRDEFSKASCFVSADPIYDQLRFARPPFVTVVNATTAFRSQVAGESFRRAVLLPMNQGEAGEVCKGLLQRVLEEEPERIARPGFPSPISARGDGIDLEALKVLDRSLHLFGTYIPWGPPSYACPISFGHEGGLVIRASRVNMNIACFTSVPSVEGEKRLILDFGEPESIQLDEKYEMGAGDAVATTIALFNTITPTLFIRHFCEGREENHMPLMELAGTIFVGPTPA